MRARWALIVFASGVLLSACQSGSDAPAALTTKGDDLGKSLIGESCRSEPLAQGGEPTNETRINIGCANITRSAGSLAIASFREANGNQSARNQAIERAFQASRSAASIAADMTCSSGQWLAAKDGSDTLFIPCFANDGKWPKIIVVAAAGDRLFVAEGLPSLLPVLERAIVKAAGRPLQFAEPAETIKQLSAAIKRPLPLLGAADFADYDDLMRAGRLYNGEQNFAAAENVERRALEIQTRLFGPTSPASADALMALALNVSNQGRFEEAASLFSRAEVLVDRSTDPLDRGRLVAYRAIDAANRGQYSEGLKLAEEATALQRQGVTAALDQAADPSAVTIGNDNPPESIAVGQSLMLEASMALRLGDLPKAEAAVTEALTIFTAARGLPLWWRAEALLMLGDINALEERYAAAQRDYEDALAFRQRIFGATVPTAVAAMKLASLYTREELYPASIASFRLALQILVHDRTARAQLTADEITPFLTAASLVAGRDANQRPDLDRDMFLTSQLVDSGVAAQTLVKASAELAIGDPKVAKLARALQAAERKRDAARVALAEETAKSDEERSARREQELSQDVESASREADLLSRQLKDKFPAYGKLVDPGPVALDKLSGQLRPGEALVSFVIGRDRGFALLVRRDRFDIRPLAIGDTQLRADVADLRRAFVPHGTVLEPYDLAGAFDLYGKLIGPLASDLTGVNHLIVVATGPLASLPFGLLVEQRPGRGQDYQQAAWLIRRFAISEVSSVRAFLELREAPAAAAATQEFLGFGDPAFLGRPSTGSAKAPSALDQLAQQCRQGGPAPAALLRQMAPLPETAKEVTTIAQLVGAGPGSVVLGASATEAAFLNHHPEQYRVLYFATHGLLPGELRCQTEPALVLSPPEKPATSKANDGLLEASEIAALHLNADLVVLSACNTASPGGRFGGEALSGLADAFFYAGARTVLASHWQVPSAETARLMTGVFQRLGPDLSNGIAESLREAQLALLKSPQTAHPFFWAAFTVIGDGAARVAPGKAMAATDHGEAAQ